jgi:hypothetical protein
MDDIYTAAGRLEKSHVLFHEPQYIPKNIRNMTDKTGIGAQGLEKYIFDRVGSRHPQVGKVV